ncbi:MAG TPA: threonine--tRNA ligase [Chlamydiales bacterium]|nr:threonine--tRNA ligase [Chlamydiales bacterium]
MKIIYENKKIELDDESNGIDLAKKLNLTAPKEALAMYRNKTLVDLSTTLENNDVISFLSFDSPEGKALFWHTSAHVLAQAIKRLFPEAKETIGPSIENGFYYDFANLTISEHDFPKIEEEVKKIISENPKPQRRVFKNKEEAKKHFQDNPYKIELIESFDESPISSYKQGEFEDLCRGPHLAFIGKIKAFKITKTSGAYWRGDQTREMLTRIYAISFPEKQMLQDYLKLIEEAKKRDHKMIGRKMDLFSIREEAPGMPFIHSNGMYMWEKLLHFLRSLLKEDDYFEIKTPILMSKDLWIQSGHWFHYRENMYTSEVENQDFALKPMSCPGCMLYYKSTLHSYKSFPLRIAEIGHVHRHELSGSLHGLFRVRSFHQDDAHIFMQQHQIKSEIIKLLKMANTIYSTFGLSFHLELSTRPEKEKTIGSDEDWEIATRGLKEALDEWKHPYQINEGDGAFYGPKIDLHIKDALGRSWQCGTIQLDMSLPEKFDLNYVDADGTYKRPIMIHRALFGSIERFYGVLIEHFAGKFPAWISPVPIMLIPVADRHIAHAEKIKEKLKGLDIPVNIDATNESVSKKIRNAQMQNVNYMITIGDKEAEEGTIALRTRNGDRIDGLQIDEFFKKVLDEKIERALTSPFNTSNQD